MFRRYNPESLKFHNDINISAKTHDVSIVGRSQMLQVMSYVILVQWL